MRIRILVGRLPPRESHAVEIDLPALPEIGDHVELTHEHVENYTVRNGHGPLVRIHDAWWTTDGVRVLDTRTL